MDMTQEEAEKRIRDILHRLARDQNVRIEGIRVSWAKIDNMPVARHVVHYMEVTAVRDLTDIPKG